MSPHLRDLLDGAADDEGRPVHLDLAAIKAGGRRATWRRRAVIGGGGVAVAALVTSVVLALAPGSAVPIAPSNGGASVDEPPPPGGPQAQELAPLIDALADNGYEIDYSAGSGSGSSGSESVGEDGVTVSSVQTAKLSVRHGDQIGSALVAEFTGLALLGDGTWDPADESATGPQCAIGPVDMGLEVDDDPNFAWESCDLQVDGAQDADLWFATGGGSEGEAIGVTMVRSDGSGISVSLNTEPYDRLITGEDAPGLDALPLSHTDLVDVVSGLEQNAPLFNSGPPLDPPSGADACDESAPPASQCETVSSTAITVAPVVEALATAGIDATESAGIGGGGSDGQVWQSSMLSLTDAAGRGGTAAIGIASSKEAAALMSDPTHAWCAVVPTDETSYTWVLADSPSAPCGDSDLTASQPLVVVHIEDGADAIGATMIRTDGSVLSVSISCLPVGDPSGGPGGEGVESLSELPLDASAMLDLLAQLDVANPIGGTP